MSGAVRPCCRWTGSTTVLPNVNSGIDAAIHSEYFKDIRNRMMAGEELPECKACWNEEAAGKLSMRAAHNLKLSQHIGKSPKLRYLEIGFSKHCNLGCRTCDDDTSSVIFKMRYPDKKIDVDFKLNRSDMDSDLSELKKIKLIGGEPLLAKGHDDFIASLETSDCDISGLELVYHTNCTIRPNDRVLEFWKKVKSVDLVISIDGVGQINEIQRPGASWDTFINTLEFYKELSNAIPTIRLRSNSVITILNIEHTEALYNFIIDNITSEHKLIQWLVISNRPELEPKNASSEKKKKIRQTVNNAVLPERVKQMLLFYIDMPAETIYTNEDVYQVQSKWDEYFGQNIRDYL